MEKRKSKQAKKEANGKRSKKQEGEAPKKVKNRDNKITRQKARGLWADLWISMGSSSVNSKPTACCIGLF